MAPAGGFLRLRLVAAALLAAVVRLPAAAPLAMAPPSAMQRALRPGGGGGFSASHDQRQRSGLGRSSADTSHGWLVSALPAFAVPCDGEGLELDDFEVREGPINTAGMPIMLPAAAKPKTAVVASTTPTLAPGSTTTQDRGGTACHCICGDRIVWHREIFAGNVVEEREHECEHEVCPMVSIPGLRVTAECTYVEDMEELTAGTICHCQCGDRAAWRNRGFYGNVVEEKERECLEELCPMVNPIPGLRFEADCRYDPKLFAHHGYRRPMHRPRPVPRGPSAKNSAVKVGPGAVATLSMLWVVGTMLFLGRV